MLQPIEVKTRSAASAFTIALSDIFTVIRCSAAGGFAVTLPAAAGFPNFSCVLANKGTGAITCDGMSIVTNSHAHVSCDGSSWTVTIGGGVETDPIFVGSAAYGITAGDKTNWGTAYTHSQSPHAPTDAQKNSDITKAEIEAKLTGPISSHSHSGSAGDATSLNGIVTPTPASTDDQKYLKYNHSTGAYVLDTPTGGGVTTTESDWGAL